ncbi:MAG: hypothetical protein C4581_07720 [Nitrospiraceae bacterium]|nr:MAG: hypothetical protein C4581_07720 [Nitrospiraceae bacterium]
MLPDKGTNSVIPVNRLCHNSENACIVIPDLIRNPVLSRYYNPLDPESPTSRDRQVQDDNFDTVWKAGIQAVIKNWMPD